MAEAQTITGEKVIWTGSISNWHYAGRWLFILLLLGGVVASFLVPAHVFSGVMEAELSLWVLRGMLAALALFLLLWLWLDKARRKYTITNKRVSVEYGILSKNSNEVRIQDIRTINLVQRGLPGLLGIGRVEFSTAASEEDDVVFWNVPGASWVRDTVRELQARAEG